MASPCAPQAKQRHTLLAQTANDGLHHADVAAPQPLAALGEVCNLLSLRFLCTCDGSPRRCRCADQQGGSVARAGTEPAAPAKTAPVVLRLPPDVLTRVDRAVEARRVKVPRHTWLMEAVIEKLEREA